MSRKNTSAPEITVLEEEYKLRDEYRALSEMCDLAITKVKKRRANAGTIGTNK